MSNSKEALSEISNSQATKLSDRIRERLKPMKPIAKRIFILVVPSKLRGVRQKVRRLRKEAMKIPELILNYTYDSSRFFKESNVWKKNDNQLKHRAFIVKEYHRIEKRLAFKEPRIAFAPQIIQSLLSSLREYQEKYGLDEIAQNALNALFAYYQFNLAHDHKDEQLYQNLIALKSTIADPENATSQGGVLKVSRQNIYEKAKLDLQDFFASRYSIRQFAPEEVDMGLVEKAVAMAQKTPSVCNRQSSKVYVFSRPEDKQKVLSYQTGNKGFGDQANKVLIVASDLAHFFSIGERNQCWIDGGMFAMSLVYALHSLGLGTCCLNWSVEYELDRALKKAVGIKNSESIIMMIAVGHLPDELKVAQSPRKNIRDVMVVQ